MSYATTAAGVAVAQQRARRVVLRLVAIQLAIGAATALAIVAFAQRLLLLEDATVSGSVPLILWGGAAMFAYVSVATLIAAARVRPALAKLAEGQAVAPRDVLDLYALPARIVAVDVIGIIALACTTVVPPLRPATNDLVTQIELVLLTTTMVSVAALPCYVMARASVAKVLELVDERTSREAIELLEARHIRYTEVDDVEPRRVRWRLLAAVAAPVAFVALGASLLVHAHVRAFDKAARRADAVDLARGILDAVPAGGALGRADALEEARAVGFDVEVVPPGGAAVETPDDREAIAVPLADGQAIVRFTAGRVSPAIGVFLLLAGLATAIAAALGARIGAAFSGDVSLATREIRTMGAADVVRGLRILPNARFASVNALLVAIDRLGAIFREFASTQERAIEARRATERMRGLFLASMSHDLKAPLNAILGFAELLSRGRLTDAQRESVQIVEQRGRELLHLVNTILDAARVEAQELSISPEWTKVGDVVMPAVMDARDLTHGSDVQIVGEIQPGVPRILVDPPRISQALTAIILVAARSAEHGVVRVRATLPAEGERMRIDVEGSGGVLAVADRDRIFEAFQHADRARRHGSLGLGPMLARSILELHEGSIDAEPTAVGGIAFHVWLPTERMSTKVMSIPPPHR